MPCVLGTSCTVERHPQLKHGTVQICDAVSAAIEVTSARGGNSDRWAMKRASRAALVSRRVRRSSSLWFSRRAMTPMREGARHLAASRMATGDDGGVVDDMGLGVCARDRRFKF